MSYRGHYINYPHNALLREVPQIYHTFALFDQPKMGNLMTTELSSQTGERGSVGHEHERQYIHHIMKTHIFVVVACKRESTTRTLNVAWVVPPPSNCGK